MSINDTLKNSHHTIEMIVQQFIDDRNMNVFNNKKTEIIIDYIQTLTKTDRYLIYLFVEYGSMRKVAEETDMSHVTVSKKLNNIIKQLRQIC